MLKKVFKYGLIAFFAFFALLGIGMTYVYFNQDDIKEMALEKINESINGTLSISGSEASLLSSFPNVSINLENPYLVSVGDTLLQSSELQLKLNLFDFVNKEYKISELEISNGLIDLKTLANGSLNFEIWKSDSTSNSSEMRFEIEEIEFQNVRVHYEDESVSNQYNTHIDDLLASLDLNQDIWNIKLDGDLESFIFLEDSTQRISEKELNLVSELIYSQIENTLNFKEIELENSNTSIQGLGNLLIDEKKVDFDLQTQSTAEGLLDVFSNYFQMPENYTCAGKIEIHSLLDYNYGEEEDLKMQNTIALKKGRFTETTSKESVENISYKGKYTIENDISDLLIEEMSSEMSHGDFQVNGHINKIPNPDVNLNFQGYLNLEELSNILALDSVLFDGKIRFNNVFAGTFKSSDFENKKWIDNAEIRGEASLDDGKIEWIEQEIIIEELNGNMAFSDEHIAVQDLNGHVGSSTFILNGTISNMLDYAFKENAALSIEAYLESDVIKLEEFLSETDNSSSQSELSFPENIEFKLNSSIADLSLHKFHATGIKGLIEYKDKRFDANNISFNTCDGSLEGRISILQKSEDNFLVTSETNAKNLNIKEVFVQFANFDQEFLTDEHISGKTDTDIYFQGNMNQFLDFQKNTIQTVADISLMNGELVQHPAMIEIASYLKKKKLLNPFLKIDEFQKNVEHLSFSELQNRILIENSKITIPKMEIKSNAMDCNISGTHGFDNQIDYRVDFRMREMLKQHEEEIEDIIVEDDGTGSRIFIAMKGSVSDPDVSFDKESARAKRKQDLKNAKKDFLEIFKKKDPNKEKQEEEIEIEVKDQAIVEDKGKKKKKGLKSIFAKDEEVEEDEALEIEIIDD